MTTADLIGRRLEAVALRHFTEEPVIALQGPRTVGKSTLLQSLAARVGASLVDLDDLDVRRAVADDPTIFARAASPVFFDEYQHAPELLDAIKAELNRDTRPGRFVLSGSTRYESLPRGTQSLTGRLDRLTVRPLTQTEIDATDVNLVEQLLLIGNLTVSTQPSATSRRQYAERVIAGGLPLALRRTGPARSRWFDGYVATALERDIAELVRVRRGDLLPALFTLLAGQTGQLLNIAKAGQAIGLDERTSGTYVHLLDSLFLIHLLPAWGRTLRSRSGRTPKVHVMDSGVGARLLRVTSAKLETLNASTLTDFGHLLESFVVTELLAQASWLDGTTGTGHWRTRDGHEVDLIIERDDGGILAVEVKASGQVRPADLHGLRKLRELVGEDLICAAVLHLGPHSYRTEDNITVLPVDRLWLQ